MYYNVSYKSNLMQEKNYEFKRKWFDYLGYEPHNGQLALHYPVKDKARFQVIVCGRRFGKTWASAMEATYVASQSGKEWLLVIVKILIRLLRKICTSVLNGVLL